MNEELKKFLETREDVDVRKLTNAELQAYHDACYNEYLDAQFELYSRGL